MQTSQLKFFYDNILDDSAGTLTATSTATGDYSIAYIHNALEVNQWLASSSATQNIDFDCSTSNVKAVDYCIIRGHNLGTAGATLKLQQSSSTSFAGEQSTTFTLAPTDDNTIIQQFSTEAGKQYKRLNITGQTTAVYISICMLGTASTIDWIRSAFDPYGQTIEANTNMTQGGYVAGIHTKYTERNMTLSWANATTAVYSALQTWWEANGLKNFFMGWDSTGDSTAIYLVRPGNSFVNPINIDKYRGITLNLMGRKE